LDFRESAGIWSNGDHARQFAIGFAYGALLEGFLNGQTIRKTPVPFAGD